ncbi:hypothetical protein [Lichenifustis flavocetrariae]|uniref:Adhesin n=1 Tax=Lichenifustis flavocetrariae TaxID=2949735 RepID=A0AA41YVH5_9HYPH|nr:hypothetical protein [Lichenifustis flavocetrariae]MCW6509359.1 hypothetical protein [Lichenifustis flavocetrariae]
MSSRFLISVLAMILVGASSARADSPYGKTFIGSSQMCSVRYGTCTGNVPIHIYLARSGRLYSFLQSEGGQMFSLGQYISVGTAQQRFLVSGNTLVFEDTYPFNGSRVLLRGYLHTRGDACSVTASATMDGQPEPITFQGSCQVYDGQR